MWDGTSQGELKKAMKTYLNQTGAADYNLPLLTGVPQSVISKNINSPSFSVKGKHKLAWFPHHEVDFIGSASPAVTTYSPRTDKPF